MQNENSSVEAGRQFYVTKQGAVPAPVTSGLGDYARRVVTTVIILAVAYLLWRGIHVLMMTFAGILFAVLLSTLSGWLSKRTGMSHGWALTVVVSLLTLLVVGVSWLLANRLAEQTAELSQKLPESLKQLHDYLEGSVWGAYLVQMAPQAAQSVAQAGSLAPVSNLFSGASHFLAAVIVILVVGIFGAAEPEVYRRGLLHLIPPQQRPRINQALDEVAFNLNWWLVGQVTLMVMMAVTTAVGLALLGVPMALALGLIAGVLELIPYLGAWLAAIPAALIALMMGPWYLVMTLALFLALHIVEGYILVPLVQRRAVHLPPALTIVSQLLLGELLGILGLFIAAPLTVAVVVFLKRLYVEDVLGDATASTPAENSATATGANTATNAARL